MIKLAKTQKPAILVENAAAWTKELMDLVEAGKSADVQRKAKYNLPEIKAALKAETFNKCAYCESNPDHVTYGDIEHVLPKSITPALTYEWSNLTFACDVCNTKKGTKEGFLDPYSIDPKDCIVFRGPMICTDPNDGVAVATVIGLALNRTRLLERRAETITDIDRQVREIKRTADVNLRDILLSALIDFINSNSTEYKACLSNHVDALKVEGVL